ncbi:HD domain-containing protein [Akkermansia muciniphila]|uniref:HD domain-containing protein n=1 Tax=Akkermansia muciniphila TaxID=239935 RepID=UPI0033BCA7F2
MTSIDFNAYFENILDKNEYDVFKNLENVLCKTLWSARIDDALPNFTDHKWEHSLRVIDRIKELTENASNFSNDFILLSKKEWFVLLIASLLHDIIMSGHPHMKKDLGMIDYFDSKYKSCINYESYPSTAREYTENQKDEIRKYHSLYAIAKIKYARTDKEHPLYESLQRIDDTYIPTICSIIKYHTFFKLSEIEDEVEDSKEVTDRLPFLVLLFRFSDELDLGKERDDSAARNQGMSKKAQSFWEIDYRTLVNISECNIVNIRFCARRNDILDNRELLESIIINHITKNQELIVKLRLYSLAIRYDTSNLLEVDDDYDVIDKEIIEEWKKRLNFKSKDEKESDTLVLYKKHIMGGVEIIKNYMSVKIPHVGDKYIIFVYKKFKVLRKIEAIKCRIHVNKNSANIEGGLNDTLLNLKVYFSVKNNDRNLYRPFQECNFSKLSAGDEYYYFDVKFKREDGIRLNVNKDDEVAILYKYEIPCYQYGRELTRTESVFFEDIVCEIAWSAKHNFELYGFGFTRRIDNITSRELVELDNYDQYMIRENSNSIFQNIHTDDENWLSIISEYYSSDDEEKYKFTKINFREWKDNNSNKNEKRELFTYTVKWNFVPFFSEPEQYLYMERYINNGSPSGFSKINTTSSNTMPTGKSKDIKIAVFTLNISEDNIFNLGICPEWLGEREIYVHEDYSTDSDLKEMSEGNIRVISGIPTASSRTVFLNERNLYVKLQYNKMLGRIERFITPDSADNAIRISNLLKKKFDEKIFPAGLFFLPENFARVVDLGINSDPRYWGMIVRDYNVYPTISPLLEIRLVPAFSLFYEGDKSFEKSILELIYLYRTDKNIDFYTFLRDSMIFPVFKLYFEILIKSGIQIEAHAQNILYLLVIEGSCMEVRGVVVRDCESMDKDSYILEKLKIKDELGYWNIKTNSPKSENYERRNSLMFDFKLGEYLITPIIEKSKDLLTKNEMKKLIRDIKKHNSFYIKQLHEGFFPENEWWEYEKEKIDRKDNNRPWKKGYSHPKYR